MCHYATFFLVLRGHGVWTASSCCRVPAVLACAVFFPTLLPYCSWCWRAPMLLHSPPPICYLPILLLPPPFRDDVLVLAERFVARFGAQRTCCCVRRMEDGYGSSSVRPWFGRPRARRLCLPCWRGFSALSDGGVYHPPPPHLHNAFLPAAACGPFTCRRCARLSFAPAMPALFSAVIFVLVTGQLCGWDGFTWVVATRTAHAPRRVLPHALPHRWAERLGALRPGRTYRDGAGPSGRLVWFWRTHSDAGDYRCCIVSACRASVTAPAGDPFF